MNLDLPDSVTNYIAENITSNVRQIEGTLNKIAAFWDLEGRKLDDESVSRAIQDMLEKDSVPSPAVIISHICKYYNMDEETLRGKNQSHVVVTARQVAMYLIRDMVKIPLEEIGKEFGGMHHSTVLYSLKKVQQQMRTDPAFKETINELVSNINARH